MSRDFTKNIANYMTLPNAEASLLNGSITAFSLWAKIRTLDTGSPNNFLFSVSNPGSGTPAFSAILISTTPSMRMLGRPIATDTQAQATGVTAFTLGQWNNFA